MAMTAAREALAEIVEDFFSEPFSRSAPVSLAGCEKCRGADKAAKDCKSSGRSRSDVK